MFTNKFSGTDERRSLGDKTKGGPRIRRKKLGFIDFDVDCNLVGTKRSCIKDCFAMVVNLYGHNLKDELYKDCPPHTYKDTLLFSVLQS